MNLFLFQYKFVLKNVFVKIFMDNLCLVIAKRCESLEIMETYMRKNHPWTRIDFPTNGFP